MVQAPVVVVVAVTAPLVRRGVVALVGEVEGLSCVAQAGDVPGVLSAMDTHAPAVLVVDPPLLRALAPLYRGVGLPRMLLVWDRAHAGAASQWAPAQPCGLVRESAPERQLRWALRQIGNCPAPSFGQGPCTWCPLRGTLQPPSLPLSPRERCVFESLGRGLGNQRIADQLGLSIKTVETYRESIKRKLGLESARALVDAAQAWCRGDFVPAPPDRAAGRSAPPVSPCPGGLPLGAPRHGP